MLRTRSNLYPTGEPVTYKLKEKHGDPICELPVPDTPLTLIVVSGPGLYITAKQSYKLARADGFFLMEQELGSWETMPRSPRAIRVFHVASRAAQ